MRRVDQQLTDAADLLHMLEQLTGILSRNTIPQAELPWSGIKLTIRQARGMLLGAQDALSAQPGEQITRDHLQSSSLGVGRPNGSAAPLADRVTQVPNRGMGRTRELLGGMGQRPNDARDVSGKPETSA